MAKVGRAAYNASKMRVETITPSADGTVSAYTKEIGTAETGEIYFVDISTNTVSIKLPTPVAGYYFRIVLATASDNEATKDLIITTGDDAVDMGGSIDAGGTPFEVTSATSKLTFDTSAGAATVGDYVEFHCDGTDWYVTGMTFNASTMVKADAI